jgi:hypothetical protein
MAKTKKAKSACKTGCGSAKMKPAAKKVAAAKPAKKAAVKKPAKKAAAKK